MKLFQLESNAKFYAENIDDAFAKLANHFERLRTGGESYFVTEGEITVMTVVKEGALPDGSSFRPLL